MTAIHGATIALVLSALLAGEPAEADPCAEADSIRGRIWCTTTTDPVLLEEADLCGDGRVFTLMLPSGTVIPLRAATPHVLQDLDLALERSALVHGALGESGVFVVISVETARLVGSQGMSIRRLGT